MDISHKPVRKAMFVDGRTNTIANSIFSQHPGLLFLDHAVSVLAEPRSFHRPFLYIEDSAHSRGMADCPHTVATAGVGMASLESLAAHVAPMPIAGGLWLRFTARACQIRGENDRRPRRCRLIAVVKLLRGRSTKEDAGQ